VTNNVNPILQPDPVVPEHLLIESLDVPRVYVGADGRAHDVDGGALEPVLKLEIEAALGAAHLAHVMDELHAARARIDVLEAEVAGLRGSAALQSVSERFPDGPCPICLLTPTPNDGHKLLRGFSGLPEISCPSGTRGRRVGNFACLGSQWVGLAGALRLPSFPVATGTFLSDEAPELIEGARTVDIVITVDDPQEPTAPGLTYGPVEDPVPVATVAPMTGRLTPDMSPAAHPALAAVVGPPASATVAPTEEAP
jgi:hypothetical protein